MPVHLSIHDVSPAWASEVELALEYSADAGARPALLVVPNFHGEWPLLAHPDFCARLRELQSAGHEVYLHGLFHKSRPSGQGLRWRFAQKVVSAGEAEFSDVTREEAIDRLEEGEATLMAAGLQIDGFVAPAWSMPSWLLPLLGERGYRFAEDHTHVYDPAASKKRASVVLNFASRTPARLFSSVAWCRLARHAKALFPARVAIHPADMRFTLLRDETRHLLAWGKGDWVPRGESLLTS
jgi:predicted deacetylase